MAKLPLSDREISLIKGLIAHKGYNDQQVLSVFSYLDRNINHRVISSVRRGATQRYANLAVASANEIDALLYNYSKITSLAEKLGLCPAEEPSSQVYKAVEIMKSAVLIYNNNVIATRSETFIVLAVIAWTYLLHARFNQLGIDPAHKNPDDTYVMIDGKPKLWELSYCIQRGEAALTAGERNNLRYIIAIRNEVEHRSYEDINDDVQAKLQATALNFLRYAKSRFGPKFDFSQDLAFAIQLQALTLKAPNAIKGNDVVAKSVAVVNASLEGPMTTEEFNDPDYAFRVYVVPKVTNNSKKADQAVSYNPVGSNVEVAIKQVERPKFRMAEALQILQAAGVLVTSHKYIQAWKSQDLKNPGKGFAVELGGQWFWYQEGIDKIREILTEPV